MSMCRVLPRPFAEFRRVGLLWEMVAGQPEPIPMSLDEYARFRANELCNRRFFAAREAAVRYAAGIRNTATH